MPGTQGLMAAGMPSLQARIVGFDALTTFSAAGTTAATATTLTADFANVTVVGANSGVRLGAQTLGDTYAVVINSGGNPLTVYPPVGVQVNGLALNTGVVVAPGKAALFLGSGNQIGAIISA